MFTASVNDTLYVQWILWLEASPLGAHREFSDRSGPQNSEPGRGRDQTVVRDSPLNLDDPEVLIPDDSEAYFKPDFIQTSSVSSENSASSPALAVKSSL